jgi:hypothetical protein
VLPSEAGAGQVQGTLAARPMFLVDTGRRAASFPTMRSSINWPRGSRTRMAQAESDHAEPTARADARARLRSRETIIARQRAFGYTDEDMKMILEPMAAGGEEPIGSMGVDTPLACLSDQAAAAVQLLQAAVCAGHESADRSDPRRNGDVADQLHRHRAQHSRGDSAELPHVKAGASAAHQSRSRKAAARFDPAICWPPRCLRCFRVDEGEEGLKRALDGYAARFAVHESGYTPADSLRSRR